MADNTAAAGTTPQEGAESPAAEDSRTFTQEEVNKLVAKERRAIEAKYENHAEYKRAYEEAQANKSELQQAMERADKAEAQVAALTAEMEQAAWKKAVSKETGVPEAALHGSTEEEVRECADALKDYFKAPSAPAVDMGKPSDEGGITGDPLRDAINAAF